MDMTIDQIQYFSLMEQAECEMEMFDYFCQLDYIEMSGIKQESGKIGAIATQFFITLKRSIQICIKFIMSTIKYIVNVIKDDYKYNVIAKKADAIIKKLKKENPEALKKMHQVPAINNFFSPAKAKESAIYRHLKYSKYDNIRIEDFLKDGKEDSFKKIASLFESTYVFFTGSDFSEITGDNIGNMMGLSKFELFNPKTIEDLNNAYEKYKDFISGENKKYAYTMVTAQAIIQCSDTSEDYLSEIFSNAKGDEDGEYNVDNIFGYVVKYWEELGIGYYNIDGKLVPDFVTYCKNCARVLNDFKSVLNGVRLDNEYIENMVDAISKKQDNANYDQRLINVYVMCAKDFTNLTTKYLTTQMKCITHVRDFYYSYLVKIVEAYENGGNEEDNQDKSSSYFGKPDADGMYSYTPHVSQA